jgi:hypothetical protein
MTYDETDPENPVLEGIKKLTCATGYSDPDDNDPPLLCLNTTDRDACDVTEPDIDAEPNVQNFYGIYDGIIGCYPCDIENIACRLCSYNFTTDTFTCDE